MISWVKHSWVSTAGQKSALSVSSQAEGQCAANFSFAQLAKRKSLGRSKPATNSQAKAPQHTVWNVSTISKPY